ncbi:DUF1868 domain-containing protein [Granulosicoccus sp.]|nr:DUF1868 domain-containing protein [Granulosicoccus sp.]
MIAQRPDAFKLLTGQLSTRDYPSGISPPGQGGKFDTSGNVQHWQGNTFVCHVVRSSPCYAAIVELQERVKRSEFAQLMTFMPAPSFHMTVFQGVSPGSQGSGNWPAGLPDDIHRDDWPAGLSKDIHRDDWPAGLSKDTHRDDATAEMLRRVHDVELASRFDIRATGLFCANSLTVAGRNDEAESKLRQARESLRTATRISPPEFDSFVFHITLGYLIQWLSENTAKELIEFSDSLYAMFKSQLQNIALEPCAFCNFDNMHAFLPVRVFK